MESIKPVLFLQDFEERFHLASWGSVLCKEGNRGREILGKCKWNSEVFLVFRTIKGHTKKRGGYLIYCIFPKSKSMIFDVSINKPFKPELLSHFAAKLHHGRRCSVPKWLKLRVKLVKHQKLTTVHLYVCDAAHIPRSTSKGWICRWNQFWFFLFDVLELFLSFKVTPQLSKLIKAFKCYNC